MKSTTTEKPNEKEYPKLMKSIITNKVVLFYTEGKGTVVYHKSDEPNVCTLGNHINDLVMSNFKDYNGSVTLSND